MLPSMQEDYARMQLARREDAFLRKAQANRSRGTLVIWSMVSVVMVVVVVVAVLALPVIVLAYRLWRVWWHVHFGG